MFEFFLAYTQGTEAINRAYAPFLKSLTRANLEALSFVNRRAQAYLELPSRLGQCRTAQELAEEQVRFWRETYEQYAESSRRMVEAWSPPPSAGSRMATPPTPRGDYIAFPQPGARRTTSRGSSVSSNGTGERPTS